MLLLSLLVLASAEAQVSCSDGQPAPDVGLAECGSAIIEDAASDSESISLLQLRSESQFYPDPKIDYYVLEAYIVAFRSYGIEKCGASPFQYVRTASIGNKSTGCLTDSKDLNWIDNQGFDNCYSVEVGADPELLISFEAFVNRVNPPCEHDMHDLCHVQDRYLISESEINDLDVWLNGKLGSQDVGHELNFVYRLTLPSTTTTTTTTAAECKIFGDPHVIGFDKATVSLVKVALLGARDRAHPDHAEMSTFQKGDFWLVKHPMVQIQGRFNVVDHKKHTFLRVVAVSGPFMHNNSLIIGPMNGRGEAKTFWNDQEILPTLGSVFENYLVKAKWTNQQHLVQDASRPAAGVDVQLPFGISMVVNRGRNGLGLSIVMPNLKDKGLEGTVDGQCGNYNGNSEDDTEMLISERIGTEIKPDQLLFHYTLNADDPGSLSDHSMLGCVSHPFSCIHLR